MIIVSEKELYDATLDKSGELILSRDGADASKSAARQPAGKRISALALPLAGALFLCAIVLAAAVYLNWRDDAPGVLSNPGENGVIRAKLQPAPPVDGVLYDTRVLELSRDTAIEINAKRPADIEDARPARSFFLDTAGGSASRQEAARDCLAQAIYYEAASESEQGQRAVAQVVLNRVRNPAFPNTVCGVVYQGWERTTGCQFSFTCDGSLRRPPATAGFQRALRIAREALGGSVMAGVGHATHYHADYVVPYWASSLDKVTTVGRHIFYLMRGALGRPVAFTARYMPMLERSPFDSLGEAQEGTFVDELIGDDPVMTTPMGVQKNPLTADLAMGSLIGKDNSSLVDRRAVTPSAPAGAPRLTPRADEVSPLKEAEESRLIEDSRVGSLRRDEES